MHLKSQKSLTGAKDWRSQQSKAIVCPCNICDRGVHSTHTLAQAPGHVCVAELQPQNSAKGVALSLPNDLRQSAASRWCISALEKLYKCGTKNRITDLFYLPFSSEQIHLSLHGKPQLQQCLPRPHQCRWSLLPDPAPLWIYVHAQLS